MWLDQNLRVDVWIRDVLLYARAPVPYQPSAFKTCEKALSLCAHDDDLLLDMLDACLKVGLPRDPADTSLSTILAVGGSAWTVSADRKSLQRALDPRAEALFELATAPPDLASDELVEAWNKAYSRNPDPSDAWDHAIKAVEASLRPIVCPNNNAATLSNVIGELRSQPWKLNVPGRARDYSVQPLVQMLELLWPDPNRHGSATPEPPATREQASAVVQLAVAIVQWARDGQILGR